MKKSAMIILLCLALVIPCVAVSAEIKEYHQSGIYTYFVMNEQEKQISICDIASTDSRIVIPSELDGYQVYALGYESSADNGYWDAKEIGISVRENMEELIIPASVKRVWPDTFHNCKKLRKVTLPEGITLCSGCFSECDNWKDLVLPLNTVCESGALPSGSIRTLQISNDVTAEAMFHGIIQKMRLSVKEPSIFSLASSWVSVTVQKLFSPEGVEKLMFNFSDGESRVQQLYVNDCDTEVEANRTYGYQTFGKVTFGEIFTVEDAKAIAFARKNKIRYHVKQTAEVKNVVQSKKRKVYEYKWKKSKTVVSSFQYSRSKKRWKKSTREIPTSYYVYGKKGKEGKYQLISTTRKRKIKTKYKYVKIEPMEIWNE